MSKFNADNAIKARSIVMEQMKDLLSNWLEDAFQRNMPISIGSTKTGNDMNNAQDAQHSIGIISPIHKHELKSKPQISLKISYKYS